MREAVEWCGSGCLTVREAAGYANLCTTRRAAAADKRAMHRPARPFAQPSERQPCRRRGRGARVQLNGLIPAGRRYVHVSCGHGHRAGRGRGAEPAMLSRQAVARRGRRTPACRGGLCIRRWVRPRQRLLAYSGVQRPGTLAVRHRRPSHLVRRIPALSWAGRFRAVGPSGGCPGPIRCAAPRQRSRCSPASPRPTGPRRSTSLTDGRVVVAARPRSTRK